MLFIGSFTLLVIAIMIGILLAVYAGIHSSLSEYSMLFGIGGWPGRLAIVHIILWFATVYYIGPPMGGMAIYTVITLVVVGSIASSFYLNNRQLLSTIQSHANPVTPSNRIDVNEDLIPVSGTIVLDESDPIESPTLNVDPVVSPFTATKCAAYEWAVKRKQWLARRRTYTTIDSGEDSGDFILDTGEDLIGISPDDPTLLLLAGTGITGYETSTRNPSPSADIDENVGRLSGGITDDMMYCETTLEDGEPVTVVGPPCDGTVGPKNHLQISDGNEASMFIINVDFFRIKHFVERYLRWTPYFAILALLVGWGYIGALFVF